MGGRTLRALRAARLTEPHHDGRQVRALARPVQVPVLVLVLHGLAPPPPVEVGHLRPPASADRRRPRTGAGRHAAPTALRPLPRAAAVRNAPQETREAEHAQAGEARTPRGGHAPDTSSQSRSSIAGAVPPSPRAAGCSSSIELFRWVLTTPPLPGPPAFPSGPFKSRTRTRTTNCRPLTQRRRAQERRQSTRPRRGVQPA